MARNDGNRRLRDADFICDQFDQSGIGAAVLWRSTHARLDARPARARPNAIDAVARGLWRQAHVKE